MLRHPSLSLSTIFCSNICFSETTGSIKAKLHVEYPGEGETNFGINGPGHMTKMAIKPIYGKNLKTSVSASVEPVDRFL